MMAKLKFTKEILQQEKVIDYINDNGIHLRNKRDVGDGVFEFDADIKGFGENDIVEILFHTQFVNDSFDVKITDHQLIAHGQG